MKKLSVLSLLMCVGSLTLAGCNPNSGGGGKKTTTGGATTSDSGSTGTTSGGTSSTSGTSGTSGTSSSSGPVYPTDWSDSLKSSMQELLDGVVLPYVPATWTAQSVGRLPFGAMGDGVDLATVQAAFEQAEYRRSGIVSGAGVVALEKESEHGVVGVGLIPVSATKVAVGATYGAYTDAWSSAQVSAFESKFGEGVTIPFVRGLWSVNSDPTWCSLSAIRINNGGTADIVAAYEAAPGWTFKEYDAQENPVYSYTTSDGSALEVNINIYNYSTYCDFTYTSATCDAWSAEDISFMNEQLAGGTIPHPAGLWSHPVLDSGTVLTQEPLATTTIDAVKGVFESAGYLVAVDPEDPTGYIFTKVAPQLDSEDQPQYIVGGIYSNSGVPTVRAYIDEDGKPWVTDEFELFSNASSVHSDEYLTLTVRMGNAFTDADVPEISFSPADAAEVETSSGNQYLIHINAAENTDFTVTASVRDGAYSDSVVIHVVDSETQTDWEGEIATNMTTALSGHKIPFVAGEWAETTVAEADYALQAPVASVELSAIASALSLAGYYDGGVQEGVQYYYTEVAEGTLYVGYSADEDNVTMFAYIYAYSAYEGIEEVAAKMSAAFSQTITAHHDEDGHWISLNFGSSISVSLLKSYTTSYFIPNGYEALMSDWGVDSSHGFDIYYIVYQKENVRIQFQVYEYDGKVYFGCDAYEV